MTRYSNEIGQLHHAALQLTVGFERAAAMSSIDDQNEAMREAAFALIEMRRCCDRLIQSMRAERPAGSSNFPQPVDMVPINVGNVGNRKRQ